uniref:uncharacterized protein LOC120326749 isoform X1 n=1 Tax=Styela clava TaxID=7725 RepID=UPI00193A5877|nr:uncharacterized protein LOC120326749 isoform X1 [Styela clava]
METLKIASMVIISLWIQQIECQSGSGENWGCENITLPFHCDDGTCVKRSLFCNGKPNCPDGSDETLHDPMIHNGSRGIACQSIRNVSDSICFLDERYRCDHDIECMGGVDECDCESTFQCDNGECALKIMFCDGIKDCTDGTDEHVYNRSEGGFQCQVTKKHVTLSCRLPDAHVCDGTSECQWGTDECFCDFSGGSKKGIPIDDAFSNDKCFRCLDKSLVIPNNRVCDGIMDCKDLSDECLCKHEQKRSEETKKLCDSVCIGDQCKCPGQLQCQPRVNNGTKGTTVCIDPESICDDIYDCENGFDESFCPLADDYFTCFDNSTRVRKTTLCNGIKDCPDGSDEYRCHEDKHICYMYKLESLWPHLKDLDLSNGYPPLNRSIILKQWNPWPYHWPYYTDACDGIPLCSDRDDECDNDTCPGELPGFCSFDGNCPNSGSRINGYEICDGQPTCNDTAPHTSVDEWGCPGRFYCKNNGSTRLPIHIPEEHRCDGIAECDDQSDEMDCNKDGVVTHFYCNDEGSTLFIPIEQKCDRRKDCKEGSDECANCEINPFSSDEKLIKSRVLVGFLWIIGLMSTFGNTAIIFHQIIHIYKIRKTTNQVALKNRVLVLNLACADLLTGIYLIALGIKDAQVEKYCLADQEWRSSSTCSALGAIAVIGTQASVMILLIMTSYRLYLVIKPFKRQKMSMVILSVIISWAIAILLGTAPLIYSAKEYFVSCVWFRSHRYLGYACKADMIEFTERLIAFEGPDRLFSKAVGSEYTWDSMIEAQKVLNSSYEPERYFGYYSAHSVCLPRLFPNTENDRSWGYSLFLVLLNFFAFVYILLSYIFIYKRTTSNKISSNKEDRSAVMQRKVSRIVLTDFCCWMPICIMAFITVAGIDIGDTAYAVTAIILLPINSAMNPFLYSSLLDVIWSHLEPTFNRFIGTKFGRSLQASFQKRKASTGIGQSMVTSVTNMQSSETENRDKISPTATSRNSSVFNGDNGISEKMTSQM